MRPPESWSRARVTLVVVAVTAAVWAVATMLRLNDAAAFAGSFIPDRVAGEFSRTELGLSEDFPLVPVWLTPLTAAFLHGGPIHVAFNLLILAFCGRPTENVLGPAAFALLYVIGAYAAAAGHYAMGPGSIAPMIGASGAVSAVLGAYAMLFGRNKVKVSNARLALWLNALWLMAAWVVLQLMAAVLAGSQGLLLQRPLLLWRYRNA